MVFSVVLNIRDWDDMLFLISHFLQILRDRQWIIHTLSDGLSIATTQPRSVISLTANSGLTPRRVAAM